MKKGELVFRLKDETIMLREDELLLFPASTPYRVSARENCEYMYLHLFPYLPLEVVGECRENEMILPRHLSFVDWPEQKAQLLGALEQMEETSHSNDVYARLKLSAQAAAFLVFVAECSAQRERPGRPDAFQRIEACIRAHISEPLSLASVSEKTELSRQYIMRLIREHTGQTATHYIQSMKLALAQKWLREGEESLETISEQIGLCGAHYLCRLFKQHYGITPGEYRNRFRRNI